MVKDFEVIGEITIIRMFKNSLIFEKIYYIRYIYAYGASRKRI